MRLSFLRHSFSSQKAFFLTANTPFAIATTTCKPHTHDSSQASCVSVDVNGSHCARTHEVTMRSTDRMSWYQLRLMFLEASSQEAPRSYVLNCKTCHSSMSSPSGLYILGHWFTLILLRYNSNNRYFGTPASPLCSVVTRGNSFHSVR